MLCNPMFTQAIAEPRRFLNPDPVRVIMVMVMVRVMVMVMVRVNPNLVEYF